MTRYRFVKGGPNPRRQNEYPHELYGSRLYGVWQAMKRRCYNPKDRFFKRYGGRGIQVCERWQKFAGFLEDMGPSYKQGLSLDRIDNDGNYEPGNCRWANQKTQGRNTSVCHFVTINGETKTVTEWAEIHGIKKSTVFMRLNRGWDSISAITKGVRS